MAEKKIDRVNTITEYHRWANLPKPEHPLISLVDYSQIRHASETNELRWIQGFYSIGLKRDVVGKYRYGQQQYDFDEGLMTFFLRVSLSAYSLKRILQNNPRDGFYWSIPIFSLAVVWLKKFGNMSFSIIR